jgi:HlyD family secretion protein
VRALARVQQLRLAQTQVLAPDARGDLGAQRHRGRGGAGGQELFRLIRQGRLEWRAEVPARPGAIRPGQAVTVTPAGGAPLAGKVRMVAPTVDASTRNGLVYVDLPVVGTAAPGGARAGMFARGEFAIGSAVP